MASSHRSSPGPDVRDIAIQLGAFEHVNKVSLSISITVEGGVLNPQMVYTVNAFTRETVDAEPAPLACVRFTQQQKGFRTMEAAIMYALYTIDFQLGEHELRGTRPK